MNSLSWRRDIFDRYAAENRTRPIEGFQVEALNCFTRYLPVHEGAEPFLAFTRLPAGREHDRIREQIAFFSGRYRAFEWKVYEFDEPSNLDALLALEGFVAEHSEAFMIFDLSRQSRTKQAVPDRLVLQKARPGDGIINDFVNVQETVWARRLPWLAQQLAETMRKDERAISAYCAYVDGRPIGSGSISFPPDSSFAELHGGAVLEDMRGRGVYRSLFDRRVEEARARGYSYLAVDAAPMSRPILERSGFDFVCNTFPMRRMAS